MEILETKNGIKMGKNGNKMQNLGIGKKSITKHDFFRNESENFSEYLIWKLWKNLGATNTLKIY